RLSACLPGPAHRSYRTPHRAPRPPVDSVGTTHAMARSHLAHPSPRSLVERAGSGSTACSRDPSREGGPHGARGGAERQELAEGGFARKIFHPAIGRQDEPFRSDALEPGPDANRDLLGRLDGGIGEVDHTQDDRLAGQIVEDAEIEFWLSGLDG